MIVYGISFFDNLRYSDSIKEYRDKISNFIAEPVDSNLKLLTSLQENSGLPLSICNTLIAEEINKTLKQLLNKENINKEELDYILKLTSSLNYCLQDIEKIEIRRKYSLWQLIDNQSLPVYKAGLVELPLKKGEVVHFCEPANLKKYKNKMTKFDYHGPSLRIRICKGFSYKFGSLNTNIKTETYVENEDAGKFYITNKRVIFVGNKNNFSYYFSQILKSELINVGLVFQKENTVSAKIVELTNYELPLLILSRILKG
jgi:hypothetical protein